MISKGTTSEYYLGDDAEEAELDENLAKTNAEAAQGLLDEIKRLQNMPTFTTCRNCRKPPAEGKKIYKCTGCGITGYCGKDCQRVHWREVHKTECKALQEITHVEMDTDELTERLEKLKG